MEACRSWLTELNGSPWHTTANSGPGYNNANVERTANAWARCNGYGTASYGELSCSNMKTALTKK